jgi:hypothetical protein
VAVKFLRFNFRNMLKNYVADVSKLKKKSKMQNI